MKTRYVFVKNGQYLKDFDDLSKLTYNINNAYKISLPFVEDKAAYMIHHGFDVQKVSVVVTPVGNIQLLEDILQAKLDELQLEVDNIYNDAGGDVDKMSEEDWKKYRRYKRCIKDRDIDRESFDYLK